MVRLYAALVAGLALVCPMLAAADSPLAGNYKITIPTEEGSSVPWLIKLDNKEGKWTGTMLAAGNPRLKGSTVEDLTVGKDLFSFKVKVQSDQFGFEGRVPKEKDSKVPVSMLIKGEISPATLEPTALTTLDGYEVIKEQLTKQTGHEAVQSAMALLSVAASKKAKPEEVRAWADKASRNADLYGPLWHREIVIEIANLLAKQEGFANVALQYARKAEGMLDEAADSSIMKKRVLTALTTALEKAGKTEEAKEVQARNDKIAYLTPKKYAGRKGKSDRVALVEQFTCAQSPACVAAELAFDALEQTYRPSEVVLLEYHLNLPATRDSDPLTDPLANPDTVSRARFYAGFYDRFRGAPFTLFNGGNPDASAGNFNECLARYEQFSSTLAKMLEEKPKASIKLSATQKGTKIDIKADVADLAETGADIRLRLALVEEKVAYTGANGLKTHHCVVRDFPGGPAGTVLKDKTATKTVTVDVDLVRKKLLEYLEKTAKDIPNKAKLVELKKLRVVAFVQNDASGEVMQAAQVEVAPGE